MRETMIVAWREYRQYVFSRGFILFLVSLPIFAAVGLGFANVVERNRPVRVFVVYDAAGGYTEEIDASLAEDALWMTLAAWDAYAALAVDPDLKDADDLDFPYAPGPISRRRLDAFEAAGGVPAAEAAIAPFKRAAGLAMPPVRLEFRRAPLPPEAAGAATVEAAAEALRPYLTGARTLPGGEGLFAAVTIPPDFSAERADAPAGFWTENVTDPALENAVRRALNRVLTRRAAEGLGIARADLDALEDVEAPLQTLRAGGDGAGRKVTRAERIERAILPAALTYALFSLVFGVANPLLTNTIEERSNKIVEMLLSSVTPDQLMFGKLIGIAGAGLTLPALMILGAAAAGLSPLADNPVAGEVFAGLFGGPLLPVFLFYFLSAFAIYSMVFLAVGAMSNSIQDAQTFLGPVMLVVFAPAPFLFNVFQDPNGPVATALTFIPFYTPYAAMLRAAADPPLWEMAVGTALMLAFIVTQARYLGRIFKNALLSAGPARARDIWRLAGRG